MRNTCKACYNRYIPRATRDWKGAFFRGHGHLHREQQGGVAKTTTSVNLGCGLRRLGCRTLLVDMDPQSSMTVYFGLDPLTLSRSSYDVLMASARRATPS